MEILNVHMLAGESATDQPVEAYRENEANIPVVIS
jgi:hypothetical protein